VPLRKVVEDGDMMAGVEELLDADRSDVPGPAGDENLHVQAKARERAPRRSTKTE
jgi:hypothetical protein